MKVKLIVAKGENNAIGKDNDLIWHLPADMKFFTETTKGNIVIMGRLNWDSIPLKYRPLSNRINAVITRNKEFSDPDAVVFHSVEEAISFYKIQENNPEAKDIFVIGGGQIFKYSLDENLLDEMFITFINESFDADIFFPEFDETLWNKTEIMEQAIDERNQYSFKVYHYTK
ncbi:dihydrofolate reductase [Crocinitomix catalasitica]|uniref:dihydrofolate reductase n=1 Tax=Crocinitomix catalasitica TaxID=184607 RepID=UPI0004892263|nr:dihydrofolate reductase [Crocinitomix catalasitica]